MSQVFISHAREDLPIVDRIAKAVNNAGMAVWMDHAEVRTGEEWQTKIVEAIENSQSFVLVLSRNSAGLEDVRKEIDLSQDAALNIIPIVLEPLKIPAAIRYQLAGLERIDVEKLGMDGALAVLIRTIQQEVDKKQNKR